MIYFNDVALESVAPVRVEDVRISPIERDVVARARAIEPGSFFVRSRDGTRTVTITFAILTQNIDDRAAQLMAVTNWARSDTPGALKLPGHSGRHLEAICTSYPEPSTRQWWESRLRLVFTCFDPYWVSDTEKTSACGTSFTVLGNALPLMQIKRTLASTASSQSYSNGAQTMTFSSIPVGDLTIDLNRQTAAVGTASIMQYYVIGSAFVRPKLGAQTITGTGTVYWRERWA